jgi:type II secretory pathway pseudopilin PulG
MKTSHGKNRRRLLQGPRKGIALILALVLIVILSVAASAALGMVSSERRVVEDYEAASEASAMARSAYDQFLTNPTGVLPTFVISSFVGPDSGKIAFSDGYAWVKVQRVRPSVSGSATLFLIRSRAVRTINRPGRLPLAERVFAQYAQFNDIEMPALAAWTSLSGILKNGGTGTISGTDNCGAETDIAGVAVPNVPGYVQDGGTSVPTGSPPIMNMGSQSNANGMVGVDWVSILGGMALSADVSMPGGSWPSFSNTNYWPVIYVDQTANFALPTSGRGMLIVKNDLTINGSVQWDGIILVGGAITSNGTNSVNGALVTGLNVLLGQAVLPSSLGNGTKTYRYNSCNVESAMKKFNGLAPLRNSGVDNWPSY